MNFILLNWYGVPSRLLTNKPDFLKSTLSIKDPIQTWQVQVSSSLLMHNALIVYKALPKADVLPYQTQHTSSRFRSLAALGIGGGRGNSQADHLLVPYYPILSS